MTHSTHFNALSTSDLWWLRSHLVSLTSAWLTTQDVWILGHTSLFSPLISLMTCCIGFARCLAHWLSDGVCRTWTHVIVLSTQIWMLFLHVFLDYSRFLAHNSVMVYDTRGHAPGSSRLDQVWLRSRLQSLTVSWPILRDGVWHTCTHFSVSLYIRDESCHIWILARSWLIILVVIYDK